MVQVGLSGFKNVFSAECSPSPSPILCVRPQTTDNCGCSCCAPEVKTIKMLSYDICNVKHSSCCTESLPKAQTSVSSIASKSGDGQSVTSKNGDGQSIASISGEGQSIASKSGDGHGASGTWAHGRAVAKCFRLLTPINLATGKPITNPKIKVLGKRISSNGIHGIDSVNDLRSWSLCPEDRRRHYLEQLRLAEIDDIYMEQEAEDTSHIAPVVEVENIRQIIGNPPPPPAPIISDPTPKPPSSPKPSASVQPAQRQSNAAPPPPEASKESEKPMSLSAPVEPPPENLTVAPAEVAEPMPEPIPEEPVIAELEPEVVEVPLQEDPKLEIDANLAGQAEDANELASTQEIDEAINKTEITPETESSSEEAGEPPGVPCLPEQPPADAELERQLSLIEEENLPLITTCAGAEGKGDIVVPEVTATPPCQLATAAGETQQPTTAAAGAPQGQGEPPTENKFPCFPSNENQSRLIAEIYKLQKEKLQLELRVREGLGSHPIQKEYEETVRKLSEMYNLEKVLKEEKQGMEAEVKRLTEANKQRTAELDNVVKKMESERAVLQEQINQVTRQLQSEIRERRCFQSRFNNARQRLESQKAIDQTLKLENKKLEVELNSLKGLMENPLYNQGASGGSGGGPAPMANSTMMTAGPSSNFNTELYLRTKSYRKALTWQKKYLAMVILGYKELLNLSGAGFEHPDILQKEIPITPTSIGLANSKSPLTKFRIYGKAIIAIIRMKFMVRRWDTKGKPKMTSGENLLTKKPSSSSTSSSIHVQFQTKPTIISEKEDKLSQYMKRIQYLEHEVGSILHANSIKTNRYANN